MPTTTSSKPFPVKSSRPTSPKVACRMASSITATFEKSMQLTLWGTPNTTSLQESEPLPMPVALPDCPTISASAPLDSLAKTLAQPEKAPESTATGADSSLRQFDLSEYSNQLGYSLRTFLLLELAELSGSSKSWKARPIACCRQSWWALMTSARRTEENESGLFANWPTPNTMPEAPNNSLNRGNGQMRARNKSQCLGEMAQWPTPTVEGNNNRKGLSEKSGDGLATAVKNWPTPVAEDSESTGARNGNPDTLTSAARAWPTPTTQQAKNNGSASQMRRNSLPLDAIVLIDGQVAPDSHNTTGKSPERLNYRWVAQLMGLPGDWLDIEETP